MIGSIQAQLNITALNTPATIDFTGFDGSGFASTTVPGQLDSDTWEVLGLSEGDLNFGGSGTSGDYARGASTGGEITGGIYAFDNGITGVILGVQPSGSDFNTGSFTLKITNTSGSTIDDLNLSYVISVLNNAGRGSTFNFSHSSDNSTFTAENTLDFSTDIAADGSPAWANYNRSITLSGVNIANNADYYLKWESADVGTGSGSRDEFGIDNISVEGVAATPSPSITSSTTNITGFTYVEGNGPSAEQSFTVNGSNLTNDIVLTAPSNYEITETSGSGYTGTITLTQSGGNVATTTIFARLKSGLTVVGSPYNQDIVITSTGATQVDVTLNGTVTSAPSPMITVNPTSAITGFTYIEGNGPSTDQSFTVNGTNLTNDIVLTAPASYEISETTGAGFTNSITLTQSSGNVATTTIYVRLISGLLENNSPFNESISITSTGASTQNVDLEGTVTITAALTVSETNLSGFTYVAGNGPSAEQSYDVSGTGLTADIVITAPTGYEVSATSGAGYSGSVTLPQVAGTVSTTTLYVRLESGLAVGNHNGNITVESTGLTTENIALTGEVTQNSSVNEFKDITVSIYPNPVVENVTIQLDNNSTTMIQITDVLGKVVYNTTTNQMNTVVNFNQPSGVYFIQITQGEKTITRKVIKK